MKEQQGKGTGGGATGELSWESKACHPAQTVPKTSVTTAARGKQGCEGRGPWLRGSELCLHIRLPPLPTLLSPPNSHPPHPILLPPYRKITNKIRGREDKEAGGGCKERPEQWVRGSEAKLLKKTMKRGMERSSERNRGKHRRAGPRQRRTPGR